jgi:hypothetical protein
VKQKFGARRQRRRAEFRFVPVLRRRRALTAPHVNDINIEVNRFYICVFHREAGLWFGRHVVRMARRDAGAMRFVK